MIVEYRLKHYRGATHAEFGTANAAYACQQGLAADPDSRVKTWFYFENARGERVVLNDKPGHGHAYSILDTLKRKDAPS